MRAAVGSISASVAVYLHPLSFWISGEAEMLCFYQFISSYCRLIALNPCQRFINLVSNSRRLKTIHPNRISGEKCTCAHGFCTVILIFGSIFSCMTVLIWLLPQNTLKITMKCYYLAYYILLLTSYYCKVHDSSRSDRRHFLFDDFTSRTFLSCCLFL